MNQEDRVQEVLDSISEQAESAGSDPQALVEVLQKATAFADAAEDLREITRGLVERALLAGVKPQDLYDKPYTGTYVRIIYNELREAGHDLPELKLGRPRRIRRI